MASQRKRKRRREVAARSATVRAENDRTLDAYVAASLAWTFGVRPADHDALVGGAALFWMNAHWRNNTIIERLHGGAHLEPALRDEYDLPSFENEDEFDAAGPDLADTFEGDKLLDETARLEHAQLGMQLGFGMADDVMMRLSVDLTGSVGALLDDMSDDAVREAAWLFASPDREIQLGQWVTTARAFYGPRWPELAEQLEHHARALVREADRYGVERVFRRWGYFGMHQCREEFGTTWWRDTVCRPFLDLQSPHVRHGGGPLGFPLPRTPQRIELLLKAPNELHGAEICGFLSSEDGPTHSSTAVDVELERRREVIGAVEPRLEDYPKLNELLFPDTP